MGDRQRYAWVWVEQSFMADAGEWGITVSWRRGLLIHLGKTTVQLHREPR